MKFLWIMLIFPSLIWASVDKDKNNNPKVFISSMQLKKVVSQAEYLGKIMPARLVHIYSPIEGIVTRIPVNAGELIKKGTVLLEVKQNEVGLVMRPVKLRAPFKGSLYRPYVELNSLVNKNDKLLTLFDPKSYKVQINASPDDSENIKIGQVVELELPNKTIVKSQVISISPDVDTSTGTRQIDLKFNKPQEGHVTPGKIAKAIFKFNERKSYLVDKQWLKKQGKRTFLRFVEKDLKIKEVDVEVGENFLDQQEVFSKEIIDGSKIVIKSSVEPLRAQQKVDIISKNKDPKKEKAKDVKVN